MGCDIHMYVEYRAKDSGHWYTFGQKINPGRNYRLFGLLAGVRSGEEPMFQPRGMPEDAAFSSRYDNSLCVAADGSGEGMASLENAKRWVSSGYSKILVKGSTGGVKNSSSEVEIGDIISHPDWHTHSWLTLDEYKSVLKKYKESHILEYKALAGAMSVLSNRGENDVRVVFWFDN